MMNLLTEEERTATSSRVRGSNSVVECHLAKVDVEGSSPFSRSLKAQLVLGFDLASPVRTSSTLTLL